MQFYSYSSLSGMNNYIVRGLDTLCNVEGDKTNLCMCIPVCLGLPVRLLTTPMQDLLQQSGGSISKVLLSKTILCIHPMDFFQL